MTIPATASETSAAGDGVTVAIPIPFVFDTASDLKVTQEDAEGTVTVITTGFSVSGGSGSTGTLTYTTAPAAGITTWILDNPAITQPTDYVDNDAFPAESHERALDRVTRIVKRLSQRVTRSLRYTDGESNTDAELADIETRKGKYLFFDAITGAVTYALNIVGTTLTQLVFDAFLEDSQQSIIGALLYPLSAAEQAAGLSNSDLDRGYKYGHVRRFKAVLDGSTDDTTALTNWAKVAGAHFFPEALPAKITVAIPLMSDSSYQFGRGGTITTATAGISLFSASSKTNISIKGAKFKQTVANNAASLGGVILDACTHCEILECEFEGMQWAGVFLNNSNDCRVIDNYFHDFLANTAGDKSDICVYRNSSYNTIQGNRCYGGLESYFGILVQDPGGIGDFLPKNNTIIGNFVKAHSGYGIAVYIGGSVESHNKVLSNDIEEIDGSADTFFGSGIYCVGFGLGGLQVIGNNVKNCCIETTSTLNGPGGITITGTAAGDIPVVVNGNIVEGMTQGSGINIEACLGGVTVDGNTVRMPSSNDGTGPGGASLAGQCVAVRNSNNTVVSDNVLLHNGPQDAILVIATDANHKNIRITSNGCTSAAGNPIRIDRTAAWVHTNVVVADNTCETSSNTPNCLAFAGIDRAAITGNSGGCGTQPAIALSACTGARLANNVFNSNGATGVSTTGTCTDSFYDRSNRVNGAFSNGGTGFVFEVLLTGSATYDPGSLADAAGVTTTVTVTGAALGDRAKATFSLDVQGMTVTAWVSAANTVSVRFQNESGGVLDLASGTLRAFVVKS